ncbi:oligopeptide ABC transporter substrate-binding protein [Shouchella clausii]|uniref:oligopeptide ABC transporter substrate-binding protein n=2 Tax=Shouchella clausii TaxID=79880 RepID=UPI000BA674AD|nr:oligopeptide ABC transporter substrate-binding protein [Shouchella clausii]MCY1105237.1 oligopeptide ABC transporter substrate-binding protein [Shouchella clausii]MED4158426.1 oligopeptide ABC transporter substrate-binding protein [Shouchella clausii]MED4177623.1 oligopeptide ABC transporter substrate-binding protein [Shouchella clausii]PAE97048.1 oligopeptide ABC transporter substrate-binding protein [Shouchella clausii]
MKKRLKFLTAPALVCLLALTACGGNEDTSGEGDSDNGGGEANETETSGDDLYSIDDFEITKENDGEAVGGILNFGVVSDTTFEGTLNWQFYSGVPDARVIEWFDESLFAFDEAFNITDEGAATVEVSEDNRTFTITIKDNVNWHDGEPVKAEDYVFAHEVIGHPDYTGVRYDAGFQNIEGMEEYHNGEADEISGFNIIDDKTVEMTFIEPNPSLLGAGLWYYAMPKHYFEGVEVADMDSSEQVREKPMGFGPFKVESIVPGESVTYTKNEDYWQGEPLLDGVTLKVINPDTVVQALRAGDVDMVDVFPATQFADNADMSNVDWLGRVAPGYSYTGFKLGKWDADAGEVVTDPDAKMADVNLRKAIAHAVNYQEIGDRMYNGLRFPATTVIPPYHALYHDESNEGLGYDPDLANQLLDEAGYEDVNGDGFRETPDGEELTITLAAMSGDSTAEAVTDYEIQAWSEIGLNVEKLDNTLHEFNSFYDRVEEDDPAIDMYSAAWSVGSDIDPSGLWGPKALFNYTRYTDDKLQELLADGLSEEAFDIEYRQEAYNEFQAYMNEVVPAAPTLYRLEVRPLNKRVSGFTWEVGNNDLGFHTIQLNAEEPVVDQ